MSMVKTMNEQDRYVDQQIVLTEVRRLALMIEKLEMRCARIESKLCELAIRLGHNVCAPRR